jgi:hypothetical protein
MLYTADPSSFSPTAALGQELLEQKIAQVEQPWHHLQHIIISTAADFC